MNILFFLPPIKHELVTRNFLHQYENIKQKKKLNVKNLFFVEYEQLTSVFVQ